jgi:hypothetical protein
VTSFIFFCFVFFSKCLKVSLVVKYFIILFLLVFIGKLKLESFLSVLKKNRSNLQNRRFIRVFRFFYRFSSFLSGSLAKRYACLTGPDIGPVHGSTGWTGRSGFDYLGCSLHYSYKSYLWYISSQRETSNTTPYVQDWTRWNVKSTVTGGPKYGRSPQPTTNESTINSNTILEFEMYILKCKS